jgi:RNA polymerase sigma-70 factor (ECF subfamily)
VTPSQRSAAGPPAGRRSASPRKPEGRPAGANGADPPSNPAELAKLAGPLTELSDAELLASHVSGNAHAFSVLVARHKDRMWAVALRTMRNPEEAADALQEAYIAAFRRAGTFRGDAAVTTWLHRVVVNACLDRIRRNKVRAAEPLPDDPDRAEELAATTDTTDAVLAKEERADIAAALQQLNPDQRAALVLVDMEGYSVEEAATMLGCAIGTIKSRCARGRARLVPLLKHLREPESAAERQASGHSADLVQGGGSPNTDRPSDLAGTRGEGDR